MWAGGDETPYDELDSQVVELCREINRFPGLRTMGSCGGHEGGGQPQDELDAGAEYRGELPADQWRVTIEVESPGRQRRPTVQAWMSLEAVAWALEHEMGGAGGRITVVADARPPFLNEPGRMLRFTVRGVRSGEGGVEADDAAEALRDTLNLYLPEGPV